MSRFRRITINGHDGWKTKAAFGAEIFLLKRRIGWIAYDLITGIRLTDIPGSSRTRATLKATRIMRVMADSLESYLNHLTPPLSS